MAVDTFKPINQTISEIFNVDGIYKIPNYQRQYSWNNDQLDALWNDLYEAFENKSETNDCYFLGSIVVVNNGKGYFELIDGQQRITTLMILMNVLLKDFPDINKNSDEIFIADKDKIQNCILFQGRKNRLQLQTDPKYDTIFNEIITNSESFEKFNYPTKKELKLDDPRYKYINTATFFYEKLKEVDEDKLDSFVNYIFYSTNIIKIECTNQSFAIKLFQVLNDRGLELSASDIVKSYIIGKYDEDDETGKSIFNNNWKNIEELSNEYGFKIDDFVVFYEYYKLKSNPKKQVVDELRTIIEKCDVYELVGELNSFANSLKKVYDSTNPIILSLRYIPWKFYVMTALTSAYQVNYENKEELFKTMRKFFYVSLISGCTLNAIKQTSFKLIEYIVDKKSIEEINNELMKTMANRKMIKKTYENLNDDVYNEKYLKPLMLSLEYEMREKTNTTFYTIDSNLHMDHILPKAYKKNSAWDYIIDEDVVDYINGIGNMALLLSDKNEEALNCGFDDKKKIYRGEGNSKGGITIFETSRIIIDEDKWDSNSILSRKEYLLDKIEKMLNISRDEINIVFEDDEPTTSSIYKWDYNGSRYSNKGLIFKLLYDYIAYNNFTSLSDIPEEIINFKMYHHELLINKDNSLLDNYSYETLGINNIDIYVRKICQKQDTADFINILKKYFEFTINKI